MVILRRIYTRLMPHDITWALTGSMAFALQGIPVDPADIDIQTDEPGAYKIEALLSQYVTQPVRFSATERIRSHFGVLSMNDVKVEIMGDMQKRNDDGTWEDPPNLAHWRRFVDADAMHMPVLALEYEYTAYLKLGRMEKAKLIKAAMEQSSG